MLFRLLPLLWALGWGVSVGKPCNNYFLVCCGLVGLVDTSLLGFQILVFGELVSQVRVLKLGVPDVGLKACTPQGEAQVSEFPADGWLPLRG